MASALFEKYEQEKSKRIRSDGNAQYVEIQDTTSSRLQPLAQDPWVDHDALNKLEPNLKDGDSVKILILGAGWGGLIYAVRLIQAGFKPEDIRIIDNAGGFGGTWYWNRYPGLMCDIESSVYMPLLEETGYMPKHRYSYGSELRAYANLIAEKWNLVDKATFRTNVHSYEWDEATHRWRVAMTEGRGPNQEPIDITVEAQFVVLASGVLNHPKMPRIPGIEDFAGDMMHTGRWDYSVTGGSPTDPTLSGLKGKKVAILGTGATAIQVVPELARWADKLYVFQRTPSSVEERGQRPVDPEEWKQVTSKKGWWKARNASWVKAIQTSPDEETQIKDGWCHIRGYKHLIGAPHDKIYTLEELPQLVEEALAEDVPRMEKVRKRVDDIVTHDKKTAEALKPWYPSWCKRPCFHDEYLQAFNLPNVTLVDTDGKGVERMLPNALVVDGKEYEVDVLVLSTGYRAPGAEGADPSKRGNVTIKGRETTISQKWRSNGASTLHGALTNSFPNLFLTGPSQAGISPNYCHTLEILAQNAAYIMTETLKRAKNPDTATVEPTKKAEEAWAMEIVREAVWLGPATVCGPSYMNNEGEVMSPEEKIKSARGRTYQQGIMAFEDVVEKWRAEGSMQGIVISS